MDLPSAQEVRDFLDKQGWHRPTKGLPSAIGQPWAAGSIASPLVTWGGGSSAMYAAANTLNLTGAGS